MQRDLVERARQGDHDAFAELAGAAISRLDSAAWLILRDSEQAKDAVQDALVRACVICPRFGIPTASTLGYTGWSCAPVSMRRAGSGAIVSMSS
jgi:DNA-directed RNA polymerase specialized sigma24 family protein